MTGDRRKLERFELNAPARFMIDSRSGKGEAFELTTRDVSSAGAFLYSSYPVPEGTAIKMEFLISLDTLQRIAGEKRKARVRVKGRVIRADQNGIAIRFDSSYKISALGNSNQHIGLS